MNTPPFSPMQASAAIGAAAGTATGDKPASPAKATTQAPSRRLIDAPTRAFHWLFALCFVGAYLSADGERWRLLHVVLGYSMAGLLTFRVLYGLVGPKQVRLTALGAKLAGGRAWLHSLWRARSPGDVNWRQGQNLFMALAVLALLVLVVPITLTGYASFNEWGGDWLGEIHEAVGEAFLWVVVGHLAAIAGLSWLRRKNVAAPMFTGRTEGRGPDVAKHNHAWLAWLLCAAVLGYVAWEWQQAPNGLVSLSSQRAGAGSDEHDD
jgi:cytochrome b